MLVACKIHGIVKGFRRKESPGAVRCGKCAAAAVKKRRRKLKEILVAEAGGACVKCGYSKSIAALEFHHRDPNEKDLKISTNARGTSLESLRKEIKKCDLLCANCHREVHCSFED